MHDPRGAAILAMAILVLGMITAIVLVWVWALVDCLTRHFPSTSERVIWLLVILFGHFVGALIYLAVVRPHVPAGGGSAPVPS